MRLRGVQHIQQKQLSAQITSRTDVDGEAIMDCWKSLAEIVSIKLDEKLERTSLEALFCIRVALKH